MHLSVPTIAKSDDIIMSNVSNISNSNIENDLKHLEIKTINLFDNTYHDVVNGGSLNSLEKLIPMFRECGTIIIEAEYKNCQKFVFYPSRFTLDALNCTAP